MTSLRIGIDVGGTFTDVVAIDAATRAIVARVKVPTTHGQAGGVADGIVEGLQRVARVRRGSTRRRSRSSRTRRRRRRTRCSRATSRASASSGSPAASSRRSRAARCGWARSSWRRVRAFCRRPHSCDPATTRPSRAPSTACWRPVATRSSRASRSASTGRSASAASSIARASAVRSQLPVTRSRRVMGCARGRARRCSTPRSCRLWSARRASPPRRRAAPASASR